MTSKAKDTTSRVTVYRLTKKLKLPDVEIANYKNVASSTENTTGFEYSLWFSSSKSYQPSWYPPFKDIANKSPRVKLSGFILLVCTKSATYGCTGGTGYHKLRDHFEIEPRFGITLAKKLMATADLKGLVQKDTSGIVNSIDRIFRGVYNPEGDIDNLHRILTNLRASFPKDNSNYAEIGSSIKAGDSLVANGTKDFEGIFAFIKKVDKFWKSKRKGLTIPELEHITPKHNSGLVNKLETALVTEIQKFSSSRSSTRNAALFLDSIEGGYLPDRALEYTVSFQRNSFTVGTYREVFEKMSDFIKDAIGPEMSATEVINDIRLSVKFDDDFKSNAKPVLKYICGDLRLGGESYFINNGLWYKANRAFVAKINFEINQILYKSPSKCGLQEWEDGKDEDDYNAKHAGANIVVLDCRFVRLKRETGQIEFCDILNASDLNEINVIHVKKACGAELRALFAQGHVSAQLYSESKPFRDKVHKGQMDKRALFTDDDKTVLAELKDKPKRSLCIVYAIYDDSSSHTPKNASGVMVNDILSGTLTLFAKIDLLFRAQSIRGLGYNVALTRIEPYPSKK